MCEKDKDVIVCDLCHGVFFPEDEVTFVKTDEDENACEFCYDSYLSECV